LGSIRISKHDGSYVVTIDDEGELVIHEARTGSKRSNLELKSIQSTIFEIQN